MQRILLLLTIPIFLLLSNSSSAFATDLDDRLKDALHQDYFRVNVLVQSTARFSFDDDNFQGGRTFQAQNARVSLRGNLDNGFYWRVFFNMVSEPNLLDAFVGYRHSDALRITAGARKPAQTLDFNPSPANTDFIGRATITGQLVGAREVGISADGNISNLTYHAGLYNGNRLGSNNNNKFYGIGRLQFALVDDLVKIAISGSHGDSDGVSSGSRGPLLSGTRTIFGADISIENDRFLLRGEYSQGNLETQRMAGSNETIFGYYLTGGFHFSENFTALARWQNWTFDNTDMGHHQLTIGARHFITDIVSFRYNFDYYIPDSGDNQMGVSAQMQVAF